MSEDAVDIPVGFVAANFTPGFLDHGGPYYLKDVQGRVIVGCRIMDHHMNYMDRAHGGVLATLADVALSIQVYRSERPYLLASTVSMATSFMSAAHLGEWIEAEGVIDRIGKQLAYVHGAIWCGERAIMTMNGVYSVRRADTA